MYSYKITNSDGTEFNIDTFRARIGSVSGDAYIRAVTPAEHFSNCIHLTVDLLNGGELINSARAGAGMPPINQARIPQLAFSGFLTALYKHPAFAIDSEVLTYSKSSEKVSLNKALTSHPNYAQYENLYRIYQLYLSDPTHKGIPQLLIKALVNFKVPGIEELTITMTGSGQQRRLDSINFPDELVPDEFLCPLSAAIMTDPAYDRRTPQQARAEKYILVKHLSEKGQNPFSRAAMTAHDLEEDKKLKASIALFVEKAGTLFKLYPTKPKAAYKKFLALLVDDTPLEIFEARIRLLVSGMPVAAATGAGAAAGSGSGPSLFGADRNAHKTILKNYLFSKYGVAKDDNPATLEKLLRCAATNGNPADVQMLLDFFAANPSAQDAKPTSKKSALHWAVIRAQENKDKPELLAKYKACVELLLGHGADRHLIDGDSKEAADYDTNKLFSEHLAPASSAAAPAAGT